MNCRLSPDLANYSLRQRLGQLRSSWILGPADAPYLARHVQIQTYSPGETILPTDAGVGCLGLVVQGEVAVLAGRGEDAGSGTSLGPGRTFGEATFLGDQPGSETLQARTHCEIWFVRRGDVSALAGRRSRKPAEPTSEPPTQRLAKPFRRWRGFGACLVVLGLVLILAVALPPTRQALALVPMSLGQWCSQQGHDRCAERSWEVAAALVPTDADPVLALGVLQFGRGNLAAAEDSFERARALAPNWSEVYNNLGVVYARRGDHTRAVEVFRWGLEQEPGSAVLEYNLGVSLQALQRHGEALTHYQSALALGDPRTDILLNMAVAYYEEKQPADAELAAQEAIRRGGPSAPALTVLGGVALERKRPAQALSFIEQAIELDANYAQAYVTLGLAHQAMMQPDASKAAFEQALDITDDEWLRTKVRGYLDELETPDTGP